MDYRNHCRTCLSFGKEMRHINSVVKISKETVRLSDILETFYSTVIEEDQNFPENICDSCVYQLTITYSFKVLIDSSTNKLCEHNNFLNAPDVSFDYYQSDDDTKIYTTRNIKVGKSRNVNDNFEVFCVECKTQFDSIRTLKEHCVNNHPIKSTTGRECEYCHEKFDDFRSLVLHRKLHMKPYICENCWEGFLDVDTLTSHSCESKDKRDKEKSERALCQCDQCGKSYPPGYIKIHMRIHGNDTPYSCKFCPKKFKVPAGLNSHVLWNHKRTRNHKCEECNATFISSSSRSTHIRKYHLKEKKYGCDSCEKRFFSKSDLQRHSLSHTGEKNFHCHLCDKSYQTRFGLNVHLKSHAQLSMNNVIKLH